MKQRLRNQNNRFSGFLAGLLSRGLCTFLAASCVSTLAAETGNSQTKPNIVFILADDMGYADAGFNGGKEIETPNLNKLAKAGSVLRSFYVQPVCSPTRASLMTGRHVAHTGVYSVVRPHSKWGLPLAERTLPQALREAGYTTAICGKWHLGEYQPDYRPTKRGFDHQYGLWFGAIDYFTHLRDGIQDWHRDDQPCKEEGYSTHLIAKEACRLIRDRDVGKPLFLYLPFNAVHGPYQVPERYMAPYGNLKGTRRKYAGMLAAMDEAIGQVVSALQEQKILENTLIVFSSDNGGPNPGAITDNGPLRAGKGTLFEGGVRVCAFAAWPGRIPSNQTVNEPMHIIDWYPTLVKLAGGSLEQKLPLDGKDLWPALTQGAKSPHEALLICGTTFGAAAVRAGDWKLIKDQPAKRKGAKPSRDEYLLFNLASDIGEKDNLADKNPEKLAEMKRILQELLKDAVPSGEPKAVR
jgi:arylsulfatase A-like enzyme